MVSTTDGGTIVGGQAIEMQVIILLIRSPYLAKINTQGEVEWELKIPKDGEYNTIYDIKRINNSEEYILTSRSNVRYQRMFIQITIFFIK